MATRVSKALASKLLSQRPEQLTTPAKGSKYGNKRTKVGDLSFASKKEAKRYCELRILQAAGEIQNLRLQPRFPLKVFGKLVTTYVADFQYQDQSGCTVVEDAKGYRTDVYKIKAKLFEVLVGFPIREV